MGRNITVLYTWHFATKPFTLFTLFLSCHPFPLPCFLDTVPVGFCVEPINDDKSRVYSKNARFIEWWRGWRVEMPTSMYIGKTRQFPLTRGLMRQGEFVDSPRRMKRFVKASWETRLDILPNSSRAFSKSSSSFSKVCLFGSLFSVGGNCSWSECVNCW